MTRHRLRALGLCLGLVVLSGCGAAQPRRETDGRPPTDRAVPPPSPGMETDGPTSPRTSTQRPTDESPDGDER